MAKAFLAMCPVFAAVESVTAYVFPVFGAAVHLLQEFALVELISFIVNLWVFNIIANPICPAFPEVELLLLAEVMNLFVLVVDDFNFWAASLASQRPARVGIWLSHQAAAFASCV